MSKRKGIDDNNLLLRRPKKKKGKRSDETLSNNNNNNLLLEKRIDESKERRGKSSSSNNLPFLVQCSSSSSSRKNKQEEGDDHYPDILDAEKIGRKYLYRIDDGEMVGIEESLKGKTVAFLFSIPSPYFQTYPTHHYYSVLQMVYKQIRHKHGDVFELVYVATDRTDDDHHAAFSSFLKQQLVPPCPWLAVPFDDLEWSRRIFKKYRNPDDSCDFTNQLFLFDPQGRMIQGVHTTFLLHTLTDTLGPTLYPFTSARAMQLLKQDNAIAQTDSLEAILSGGGGFVVKNDGKTKVPISQLLVVHDNVVVGLLFYRRGVHRSFMEKVVRMYNQVNKQGHTFEIIFINVSYRLGYTDEPSFLNALKAFPHWFALPFNDQRVWRLHSTLTPSPPNIGGLHLAIIGPSSNPFLEIHALDIFREYGIQAYPFSLDNAVNCEMERLKKKKLADYFKGWRIKSLLCQNGKHVKVSSFLQEDHGKGVLLYIASHGDQDKPPHKCEKSRLLELYNKNIHTLSSSFKVVFLSLDRKDEDVFIRDFHNTMPSSWLAIHCKSLPAKSLYGDDKVLICQAPHILAFDGTTGCLLKMGALESFGADKDFPYINHQDYFDFLKFRLANVHGWDIKPPYIG